MVWSVGFDLGDVCKAEVIEVHYGVCALTQFSVARLGSHSSRFLSSSITGRACITNWIGQHSLCVSSFPFRSGATICRWSIGFHFTVPFRLIQPSRVTGPVVLAEFSHLSRITTPMADDSR